MAVEVGKKYYFFIHAYHQVVGEVVEILGKKEVILNNVVRIRSNNRAWTDWWKNGIAASEYDIFPDGTEISGWFMVCPWNHNIPKK